MGVLDEILLGLAKYLCTSNWNTASVKFPLFSPPVGHLFCPYVNY